MLIKKGDIIRVFLVDDHPIIRRGLAQLLNYQPGITVCGTAEDANTAIAAINSLHPDIIIVDLNLRGISGFELIEAIRSRYRHIKIIILSMYEESEYIERGIRAGAMGYIAKSDCEEKIIEAIHLVAKGKTFLSESLKDKMLDSMLWNPGFSDAAAPVKKLTGREFDIFQLIGKGCNARQIAGKLNLSIATIGTCRDRIKTKLNINDTTQLIKYAIEIDFNE